MIAKRYRTVLLNAHTYSFSALAPVEKGAVVVADLQLMRIVKKVLSLLRQTHSILKGQPTTPLHKAIYSTALSGVLLL